MAAISINDSNKIAVELAGKMYVLHIQDIDSNIDVDELVKIDYSNIMGELLTFAVIKNRIGLLKAEAEAMVSEMKFEMKKTEARLFKKWKLKLSENSTKPTEAAINASVVLDEEYQESMIQLIDVQKSYSIMESIYWAANEKSEKLKLISDKLKPEEFTFEIVNASINGVLIKQAKKPI